MNQNSISGADLVSGQRSAVGGELGLIIILIAFTGLALLYDFSAPIFEKPDELKHFAVIHYIQTRHQLPVVRKGIYKPWDQEGTQPPLYHILSAAATSWLDLSNFTEPARNPHYVDERSFVWRERGNNNLYLHAPGEVWSTEPVFLAARLSRWLSLLAGLATITLTFFLARITFSGESPGLPLLAAALVAFIPQFLHVSSAITNDGLSATIAAAALVMLALVIRNGGSFRYAMLLGIILGLGAIIKLSLLYLVPLTGLVLLLDWWRHRSLNRLLQYGAVIVGLMLLLAGWWYWRNWRLYGDISALNAHLLYRGGPLDPRPTLAEIWQTELTGLELSFWAAFGAGQILLEPWIYEVLRWMKYLVLVGLVIGVWRTIRWQAARHRSQATYNSEFKTQNSKLFILALLALWTLIIFVALLRWMQITPASWGRLLYPALPAMAVLVVWGLSQFTIHNTCTVPGDRRECSRFTIHNFVVPLLLTIALFLLALISPFRYINAAYGKTPLISEADIPPENVERLDFTYDDTLRLIGYTVDALSVRPGEWLPVTLYWQAVRPIDKNYSAFVHLLGRNNRVIGQVNTYPAGGNWPTSMLETGQVLKDTYYVPVSPDADAPAVIRLAVGIFEFEDPARTAKAAVNASGEDVEPIVGAVPLLPHRWPQLDPDTPLVVNFADQIQLAGYDWPNHAKIKPGETVPLTFYWETLASPGQPLNLFIHLVDPATGTQVAGFDGPPEFPTEFWQPGNTIVDSRALAFPVDLPPGDYELRIGWYNLEDFARLPLADKTGDNLSLFTVSIE